MRGSIGKCFNWAFGRERFWGLGRRGDQQVLKRNVSLTINGAQSRSQECRQPGEQSGEGCIVVEPGT